MLSVKLNSFLQAFEVQIFKKLHFIYKNTISPQTIFWYFVIVKKRIAKDIWNIYNMIIFYIIW